MRISDWSSDVCSSDLVGAALAVAVVAVHRAARGVDRDLVVVHAQPVALRIGVVEQARLQHLVRRRADARHQVARRERGLLDVRSEEHTSELQSLMRISYAVFCLKTKTTRN